MASIPQKRLSGAERRQLLLENGSRLFADNGYAATSTAQLAASMGVSEPVLYRHFSGKKAIYIACIENAWVAIREAMEAVLATEADPSEWMPKLGSAGLAVLQSGDHGRLWLNALTDRSIDDDVREIVFKNLGEVHTMIAGVMRNAQKLGGMAEDRDARAEAWMFVAVGMLQSVAEPGRGPTKRDITAIQAARRDWLQS